MKKSALALCTAALAFAAFAQDADVPAPEAKADRPARSFERGPRNRQPPTALTIDAKTTPEQIEAFKKDVAAKIDAAVEAYKAKPAEEGKEKSPMRMMLMVMERPAGGPNGRPGMGQNGRPGMGPNGARRGGARGNRPGRPEGAPAEEGK